MLLSPSETYTALIRWRGPDPKVEIETRHSGFTTPEDAALFANSISPESPLGLRVADDTSLQLLLADGRYDKFIKGQVTLRVLEVLESQFSPDPDDTLPPILLTDDDDFLPRAFDEIRTMPSALGDYEQAQYAVLTDDGYPVDVSVDWDATERLRITVNLEINKDVLPKVSPTTCLGCFSTGFSSGLA